MSLSPNTKKMYQFWVDFSKIIAKFGKGQLITFSLIFFISEHHISTKFVMGYYNL